MSQIRSYVVDGYNWETVIIIDVEGKTDLQIQEELSKKGLEWFKSSVNKNLKLSVMMGFYKKITEDELPKSNGIKSLLANSSFIRSKKDLFYGQTIPICFSKEEI